GKMAVGGNCAAPGWMAADHRREVPPGRPAADIDVAAIESEVISAIGKEGQRLADLRDNVGQPGVGRERVSRNGDVYAMRARPRHYEAEPLLLVALPVAAVDEHE